MPPKKASGGGGGGPSKKTEAKKKDKVIEVMNITRYRTLHYECLC